MLYKIGFFFFTKQPFCASAFSGRHQSADRRQTVKMFEVLRSFLPWSERSSHLQTATSTAQLCDLSHCFCLMFQMCQGRKKMQRCISFALFFPQANAHNLFRSFKVKKKKKEAVLKYNLMRIELREWSEEGEHFISFQPWKTLIHFFNGQVWVFLIWQHVGLLS